MQEQFQAENILEAPSSEHGIQCLAWNESPFDDATRLVCGGYSKRAAVWVKDAGQPWRKVMLTTTVCKLSASIHNYMHETQECELGTASDEGAVSTGVVVDVAWAPQMGRSYHMIAVASKPSIFTVSLILSINDK